MFPQDEELVNFSSACEREDWMEAMQSGLSTIKKKKARSLDEKNKTHWC